MNHCETVNQISRNTLACVGASDFVGSTNALTFRVRVDNQRRYVRITLTPMDTYTVEQVLVRGAAQKVTYRAEDVYCDALDEVVYRLGSTRHAAAGFLAEVGIKEVN